MSSHCLICLGDLDGVGGSFCQKPSYIFPGSLDSTLLNEQLWCSFVLTKIVKLPSWKFESLLTSNSGTNPGKWFDLCSNCCESVVQIVKIKDKIRQLQSQVDRLEEKVTDKFKNSLFSEDVLIKGDNGKIKEVSQEIRQFFKVQKTTSENNQLKRYFIPVTYLCTICPRKLKSQALLDKHYRYHEYTKKKFNGRFDCTVCKVPWSRLFHLKTHYKNVHKLELPNDEDNETVKVHIKTEIDGPTCDDDDDGEPFNSSSDFEVGLGNDMIGEPRIYPQIIEGTLDQHPSRPAATIQYRYQCSICPRKLRSEALLDKHYKYHDYTKRKFNGRFDCTLCGAPCARLFHLRNHYQNVHKVKLHKNWDISVNDNQEVKVDTISSSEEVNVKMEIDLEAPTGTNDGDDEEAPKNISTDKKVKLPSRKKRRAKMTFTGTFQCSMCTQKYKSEASLNKHLDYHQMTRMKYNGKFDCDKCGTPFARILHLTNHYRNVHQCTLDQAKFQDHHQECILPDQNNSVYPEETECPSSSKKRKVNGLPVSTTTTPLVCELCGFIAKKGDYAKQQMKSHMLNHKIFDNSVNPSVSTTKLICNLCNQLFKSRTDLRSHMVTIHASELGLTSHQCSYCPRQFPNKHNLFDHEQRIHKKKGRFPCPHCDHEAMNPYRLSQHMAKHTKERDICQYCSATYTKTGGRLREHIKRHHPDKYVPSTSRMTYGGVPLENTDLITKKPILRKFKCKYCNDGGGGDGIIFGSQLAYTMHLEESHKDLYKFECDLCGNDGNERKKYMSLTSLNYHKKIHHQEKGKGAKCGWCGVKVAHRFYLYGHRKNCKSRPEGATGILAVDEEPDND